MSKTETHERMGVPRLLRQFFSIPRISGPSEEDFLPRAYRLQQIRLRQLADDTTNRKLSPREEALTIRDWRGVDWPDLYELELAVVRWLPDDQLEMEMFNIKQRYLEIVGKLPDSWVTVPQAKATQPGQAIPSDVDVTVSAQSSEHL
jgi:hypothetical protein